MVVGGMATLAMTYWLTPWKAESVGHAAKHSLWRWFDGFRNPHMVIITSGVANTAPGYATSNIDDIQGADSSDSATVAYEGLAIWTSHHAPHTVTAGEGTILTAAGYTVT